MSGRSIAAAALLLAALAAQGRAEEKKSSFRNIAATSGERGAVRGLRLTALNLDGKTTRSVADGGTVNPGDKVKVCFNVTRGGYVSLWSESSEGDLSRILPNEFMTDADGDGVAVHEGEYCVAENGLVDAAGAPAAANRQRWWFEVQKPHGDAQLFLYWTSDAKRQPPDELVADIDALDAEIGKKRSASRGVGREGGVAYVYRVVPAGGGQ